MSAQHPKVALVDATEAKNRFGEVIKRAYEQEEHLIVRRGGLPVVAIIPVQDYEQLVNAAAQGEALSPEVAAATRAAAARARLRSFLATAHAAQPASGQEVEQEIEAAVKAVRKAGRGAPTKRATVTSRTARARASRRR